MFLSIWYCFVALAIFVPLSEYQHSFYIWWEWWLSDMFIYMMDTSQFLHHNTTNDNICHMTQMTYIFDTMKFYFLFITNVVIVRTKAFIWIIWAERLIKFEIYDIWNNYNIYADQPQKPDLNTPFSMTAIKIR